MSNKLMLFLVVGFFVLISLIQSVFVVDQTEQALVVRFGDIKRIEQNPGLKFKVPFVDEVVYYDNRLLEFNAQPEEVITEDEQLNIQERILVNAFVKYRITDPAQFYVALRTETGLRSRLDPIVRASLRRTIGEVSLRDLLSEQRSEIMQKIRDEVNRVAANVRADVPVSKIVEVVETEAIDPEVPVNGQSLDPTEVGEEAANTKDEKLEEFVETTPAEDEFDITDAEAPFEGSPQAPVIQEDIGRGFGIDIVDVRIMRADLPEEISQSTYERMKANFAKEAQKFRAEGEESALQIRSTADRQREEILADARKKAEIIRGEADGKANKIYANAFSRDEEFFNFYRAMQSYKKSLKQDDTTVVLSPSSEFLRYLDQ
jgi:membrane protease subunit HflC